MDPTIRLRLATRIHFALLRHYGEDVAVSTLLRGGDAAREALWVCEASEHGELVALVRQFGATQRAESTPRVADAEETAPQDTAWGRNSSGFGITGPGDLSEPRATPAAGWLSPARWLKRGSPRSTR